MHVFFENSHVAEWNIRFVYRGQSVESCYKFEFPTHQVLFLVCVFVLGFEAEEESVEAIVFCFNSSRSSVHVHPETIEFRSQRHEPTSS